MFEYRYRHVTQISVKHVHILGVSYREEYKSVLLRDACEVKVYISHIKQNQINVNCLRGTTKCSWVMWYTLTATTFYAKLISSYHSDVMLLRAQCIYANASSMDS